MKSLQGINPDITQAVLSTTDAFRKGPRYVFALMPRNLGEGTNTAVTTVTSVWVKPLSEAKNFPRHDCHFLPIHRSTDRDITTGRNWRAESRKLSLLNFAIGKSLDVAGAKSASVLDVYHFCPRWCTVFSPDCQGWHRTTQVLRHDLSTVVAILFTLTGFTEERSFLHVQDDWKLLSSSHLPAPQPTAYSAQQPKHQGPRWFPLPRRHLRQRRPAHPSDPVLHRRRCAESDAAHGGVAGTTSHNSSYETYSRNTTDAKQCWGIQRRSEELRRTSR